MMIEVLKSKLHCVQVTEANLNYMGCITIDGRSPFNRRRESADRG